MEDTVPPKLPFPTCRVASIIGPGVFYDADQTLQSFSRQLCRLDFHASRTSISADTDLPAQAPLQKWFCTDGILARGYELVGKMVPARFRPSAGVLLFTSHMKGSCWGVVLDNSVTQSSPPWPSRHHNTWSQPCMTGKKVPLLFLCTAMHRNISPPSAPCKLEIVIHSHLTELWGNLINV